MAKPLLLMDIDGTLLPYGTPDKHPGYEPLRAFGFDLAIAPHLLQALPALQRVFEWVWLTTWEIEGVRELEGQLGLPALTRAPIRTHSDKLAWVREQAATEGARALAWADDRLGSDWRAWARQYPAPTLLSRCDRDRGLSERQLRALFRFGAQNES